MNWTLETKTHDVAPTKRGDEWKTQVVHYVRDERGRLVVAAAEDHMGSLMRDLILTPDEKRDAMRLIAAAPALRDALVAALAYNDAVSWPDGRGQFSWATSARAALALLDANARAEVAA